MESPAWNLIWSIRLIVRWPDLDANGHVNNAVFFTYREQARVDWMHSLAGQTTADGYGAVVKKTSCTYLRPVTYPATLDIRLFAGKPGRTSFSTYSEIWNTVPTFEKTSDGDAVMVWVHHNSGRPHAVPEFLRKLLPE